MKLKQKLVKNSKIINNNNSHKKLKKKVTSLIPQKVCFQRIIHKVNISWGYRNQPQATL